MYRLHLGMNELEICAACALKFVVCFPICYTYLTEWFRLLNEKLYAQTMVQWMHGPWKELHAFFPISSI